MKMIRIYDENGNGIEAATCEGGIMLTVQTAEGSRILYLPKEDAGLLGVTLVRMSE